MATSGTIGQFVLDTRIVIDHAFGACKLAPQQVAGEYIDIAIEQLQLMLAGWATVGTPLWCKTKYILPLLQGVYRLDTSLYMPPAVDVIESNLRMCTRFTGIYTASTGTPALAFDGDPTTACTETAPGGNITLQLTTAMSVENVGIMPASAGSWDISLQWSNDGVNWTTFFTDTDFEAVAGTFQWFDFQGLPVAAYWRLLANGTTVLNVAELFFGNNAQEIPIARINEDDYWNLPNKTFQGRPVQYWCDRQVNGPVMNLWPAPGPAFVFQQVTVLMHRHIMDVGQMTDTLEVPQRTFDCVVFSLAERLRMVIPEVDKKETQDVPAMALNARKMFWGEEVDRSPMNLQIDISAYTR